MPVTFDYCHEYRYLLVTYAGKMAPGEIIEAWADFVKNGFQNLGYNTLVDLSGADLSAVPMAEVEKLTELTARVHDDNGIAAIKVANYAPTTLPFGMARAYEGMSVSAAERIRVFKDLDEAKAWLAREDTPGAQ